MELVADAEVVDEAMLGGESPPWRIASTTRLIMEKIIHDKPRYSCEDAAGTMIVSYSPPVVSGKYPWPFNTAPMQ